MTGGESLISKASIALTLVVLTSACPAQSLPLKNFPFPSIQTLGDNTEKHSFQETPRHIFAAEKIPLNDVVSISEAFSIRQNIPALLILLIYILLIIIWLAEDYTLTHHLIMMMVLVLMSLMVTASIIHLYTIHHKDLSLFHKDKKNIFLVWKKSIQTSDKYIRLPFHLKHLRCTEVLKPTLQLKNQRCRAGVQRPRCQIVISGTMDTK